MVFLDYGIDLIAHAKVQRQVSGHTKIILNKSGIAPVVNVASRISNEKCAVGGQSRKEIFNALRVSTFEVAPNELDSAA